MLHCELEMNFIHPSKDFCCRFIKRKSLKLTEESKFFAVNDFKQVTVFSKHLKEDKKPDNVTKKSLSRDVRSDNCCTEMLLLLFFSWQIILKLIRLEQRK